ADKSPFMAFTGKYRSSVQTAVPGEQAVILEQGNVLGGVELTRCGPYATHAAQIIALGVETMDGGAAPVRHQDRAVRGHHDVGDGRDGYTCLALPEAQVFLRGERGFQLCDRVARTGNRKQGDNREA